MEATCTDLCFLAFIRIEVYNYGLTSDSPNHMVSSSGPLMLMKLAWHSFAATSEPRATTTSWTDVSDTSEHKPQEDCAHNYCGVTEYKHRQHRT